jgi:hypothetical protein
MFHGGGGHGGGGHGGGGHGGGHGGGFRGGRGLLLGGGVWGPWGVYDCLDEDDPFCAPGYPLVRGYGHPIVIGSEASDDLFDDTMLGSGGIGKGMMG